MDKVPRGFSDNIEQLGFWSDMRMGLIVYVSAVCYNICSKSLHSNSLSFDFAFPYFFLSSSIVFCACMNSSSSYPILAEVCGLPILCNSCLVSVISLSWESVRGINAFMVTTWSLSRRFLSIEESVLSVLTSSDFYSSYSWREISFNLALICFSSSHIR